ncbi:MAG: cysteine hydrolase [Clostridia bacterium]|nr:cysteine hydrolase [Clostridia bacterium]
MKLKNFKDVSRLFINIDMVNGFIKCGVMHDKNIAKIIKEQIELIERCKEEDDLLVFVKEGHCENAIEFNKFPKHCIKGTEEAEIVDELLPFAKDAKVYQKNSTSAIFAKDFLTDVASMINLKEVVLMGCCTDICVLNLALPLANYFDEKNKQVNIVVPMNVVQTYDSPNHNKDEYNDIAFKLMRQAGIKVVENYIK